MNSKAYPNPSPAHPCLRISVSPCRIQAYSVYSARPAAARQLCTGLEKADAGEINGNTGLKFSYVFQEDRLLPSCTVLKNIAVVSDENEALKQLKAVHLEDAADKYPHELSGGMSRRAALARAFAYGGDVLILDEPFKGLETELRDEIAALVKDFARTKPVILVTHDEGEKQLACGYYELRAEQ